jgi:hypothetical protein
LRVRTCHLARALTGAEQAAFKVDLDGDGHAARKFFNLSERYERWRDYRVDPQGRGLNGLDLAPGEVWGGWPPVRPPAAVR